MVVSNNGKTNDPATAVNANETQDDASDTTTKGGRKIERNEREYRSFTSDFSFQPALGDKHGKTKAIYAHLEFLEIVRKECPDVQIYDNHGKLIKEFNADDIKIESNRYETMFQIHTKKTKRPNPQHFVLHRISSKQSFSEIKQTAAIRAFLQVKKAYLREHRWDETVTDTCVAAYIINKAPKHYPPDIVQSWLQVEAEKASSTTLPEFKLIPTRPSIIHEEKKYAAPAYVIEIKREDKNAMAKILKAMYTNPKSDATNYLLFESTKRNPPRFADILNKATKNFNNTYTIPLRNMTSQALKIYVQRITSIPGVHNVIPTRDAATTGRFNVLVDKQSYPRLAKTLPGRFAQWYDDNQTEIGKVSTELFASRPHMDTNTMVEYSDGENTYDSITNQTFGTIDLSNHYEIGNPIPTIITTPGVSYANVTNNNHQPPNQAPTPAPSLESTNQSIALLLAKITELTTAITSLTADNARLLAANGMTPTNAQHNHPTEENTNQDATQQTKQGTKRTNDDDNNEMEIDETAKKPTVNNNFC